MAASLSHCPVESAGRHTSWAPTPSLVRVSIVLPASPASLRPIADLTVLQRLEAESIHIMREVVAECERPVMLYSIGKDSSVMLHLAMKAFYPAKPPFPLLHVDTTWKFREMIAFRDETAEASGTRSPRPHQPRGQ